jgi:hypothetical protein
MPGLRACLHELPYNTSINYLDLDVDRFFLVAKKRLSSFHMNVFHSGSFGKSVRYREGKAWQTIPTENVRAG